MRILIISLLLSMATSAAEIDLTKSKFTWHGTKVSGKHEGTVKLKSGKINFTKNKIKSAELVMNMNSIDITELEGEWRTKFLTHIKSSDFFNTKKFPTATLLILGDNGKNLNARLTILGASNDVTIPYTNNNGIYSGTLKFNRTSFGLKYGSGSFFKGLGDKMIHDEVTVDFSIISKP